MGTQKLGFGYYPQYHGEIELSTFAVAPHFEKSSNMAKNEEKPCSTCLKPISPLYSRYPKIRFWVPVLPLVIQELASFSYQLLNLTVVTSKKRNSREDFY